MILSVPLRACLRTRRHAAASVWVCGGTEVDHTALSRPTEDGSSAETAGLDSRTHDAHGCCFVIRTKDWPSISTHCSKHLYINPLDSHILFCLGSTYSTPSSFAHILDLHLKLHTLYCNLKMTSGVQRTDIDRRTCTRVVPMRVICAGLPRTGTMCAFYDIFRCAFELAVQTSSAL